MCADPVVRIRIPHVLRQAAATPRYQGCTALICGRCKHVEMAGATAGTCMCRPLHICALIFSAADWTLRNTWAAMAQAQDTSSAQNA